MRALRRKRAVGRRGRAARAWHLSPPELALHLSLERGMNRYDLQGRSLVITGGAGGIGLGIARLALASGARVSLWDHAADRLAMATGALGDAQATPRCVDVTHEGSIATALAQDVELYGRIDAFVNNAGILGEVLPLWETTPMSFRRVVEVNLVGAYLCLRAVLDVMRRQDAT